MLFVRTVHIVWDLYAAMSSVVTVRNALTGDVVLGPTSLVRETVICHVRQAICLRPSHTVVLYLKSTPVDDYFVPESDPVELTATLTQRLSPEQLALALEALPYTGLGGNFNRVLLAGLKWIRKEIHGESMTVVEPGTRYHGDLELCNEAIRDTKDIVLAAVRQEGRALQFASIAMRDDREVVLAAMRQEGGALQFARGPAQRQGGGACCRVRRQHGAPAVPERGTAVRERTVIQRQGRGSSRRAQRGGSAEVCERGAAHRP